MYIPKEGDTYDDGKNVYLFTNQKWVHYATLVKPQKEVEVCSQCGNKPANLPSKLCKSCAVELPSSVCQQCGHDFVEYCSECEYIR